MVPDTPVLKEKRFSILRVLNHKSPIISMSNLTVNDCGICDVNDSLRLIGY
jgi:hypothetical protein